MNKVFYVGRFGIEIRTEHDKLLFGTDKIVHAGGTLWYYRFAWWSLGVVKFSH